MKEQNIVESFNCAIEGFVYVIKTQRNMRIHFLIAAFVILLAIYLNFARWETLMLCTAITFVILSEMVNTVVELTLDMIHDRFNPLVRIVKDVSAAAVLMASFNAVVVGYLLFSKHLAFSLELGLIKVRQSPWHLTFISLIIVLVMVVMIKAVFHRGKPLRGGMPSGHSAMAFSMWTVISLFTYNGLVSVLAFIMAILVARGRLVKNIHTTWEVFIGGVIGSLITLLVFQLLR